MGSGAGHSRGQAASCLCSGIWSGCPGKGVGWPALGIRRPSCLGETEKGPWPDHSSSSAWGVAWSWRGQRACPPSMSVLHPVLTFPMVGDVGPSSFSLPTEQQVPGARSWLGGYGGARASGPCPAPCMDLCRGPSDLRQPPVPASRWGQEGPEAGARGAVFQHGGVSCLGASQGPQALACLLSLLWDLLLPWALPP